MQSRVDFSLTHRHPLVINTIISAFTVISNSCRSPSLDQSLLFCNGTTATHCLLDDRTLSHHPKCSVLARSSVSDSSQFLPLFYLPFNSIFPSLILLLNKTDQREEFRNTSFGFSATHASSDRSPLPPSRLRRRRCVF